METAIREKKFSILRVILIVGGILAAFPLTLVFGLFGFILALFFILLIAIARA